MPNPEPPKPSPTPTPEIKPKVVKVTKPHRPWTDYLPMATGILALIWFTQLFLIQVVGDTTRRQLSESAVLQQQLAAQQKAGMALDQNREQIQKLVKAYPAEDGIIEFINQIKVQIADVEESKVQISNSQPIKTDGFVAPFVPMSLTMNASASAILKVLETINNSPYLLQPSLLEINALSGLGERGKIEFKGNLYVSSELIQ